MKRNFKLLFIVFALTFLFVLPTSAAELPQAGTIETSAMSSVKVAPDIVQFSLTIRSEESSGTLSQEKNALAVNRAIELFASEGINNDKIKTTNYSTYSYTKTDSDQKVANEITVYSTNSGLEVTSNEFDKVGGILGKLAKINEVYVNSVNYSIQDTAKYKEQLIASAIAEAKQNILYSANALGVKLDKLNSLKIDFISDSVNHPYLRNSVDSSGSAIPQPQNPDKITISASANMSYSVQQ